jgi:ABC-type polysaccharide/polyol phosphate transport system ATPase subunit
MSAIRAHHLSKVYRIYSKPKDRLKEYLVRGKRRYHQEFWALRDVSFEVWSGSTLGIIGDNGAGKSTLLQIVAGTVRPTGGTVQSEGRISAILELGAGFNPEFTGRENAFMNGAIMGISEREMERRLPEIAAFAEIGDFIDRPVKIYSSGMTVRLAFAVATSIDPDLLIIDEALAVGDQYFQKKCIDRIISFHEAGKTILFCSHNLYQVRVICEQVIWLRDGQVTLMGETQRVVDEYESYLRERMVKEVAARDVARSPVPPREAGAAGFPWISDIRLGLDGEQAPRTQFQTGENMAITVSYEVPDPPTLVHVGVIICRNDDVKCYGIGTHVEGVAPPASSGKVTLFLPNLQLLSGEYHISVYLLDQTGLHPYDQREKAVGFWINQPFLAMGICQLEHEWRCETRAGARCCEPEAVGRDA